MTTRKRSSFRSRGAAIGRSMATGFKGTLIGGGTGAAVFFAHDQLNKNVEFLGKTPWVTPAALLVVGHVLKQRRSLVTPGIAVCGAAGYALGNALSFMMSTRKAAADAKGLMDQETGQLLEAGSMNMYDVPSNDEAGALVSSADTLGM